MISSMTAFARVEAQGDFGSAVWELRGVNHRYLEVSIRLPDTLYSLESAIREKIRDYVQRGKIECSLRYQSPDNHLAVITLNMASVQQLIRACKDVEQLSIDTAPLNVLDILRWPGVITPQELDLSQVQTAVLSLLEEGLKNLVIARDREGKAIEQLLQARLASMRDLVSRVKERLPELLSAQRDKLIARLSDVKTQLEPSRLEQEMVMYAQKIDVAEELDRLTTHIAEVARNIQQGGSQGRRLDFLMQELNREANTLGAKVGDADIISIVVELKVLIEQMREQIQNIE